MSLVCVSLLVADSTLPIKLKAGWDGINWRDGRCLYLILTILDSGILIKPKKSNALKYLSEKIEISIMFPLFIGQPGKDLLFP